MEQDVVVEKKKAHVTGDMTIGDVVRKFPQSIEVLQSAGVHCVGCHVSYVETIEQGLSAHNMTETQITEILSKINEAIEKEPEMKPTPEKPFFVTEKAAKQLKAVLKEEGEEDSGLRVEILPGGCSGFEYGLELDDEVHEDDTVIEQHDVKIFIGKENLDFLNGAKLDYVDSLQGGGFKITNPNAKASCGCGQSFNY